MASVAGRQRAVEHRVAEREGVDHVVRPAHAERVLRRLGRQRLGDPAHRLGEQRAVGGQRPAAEAVAVEADLGQRRRALPPQRLDPAALDDGEDPRGRRRPAARPGDRARPGSVAPSARCARRERSCSDSGASASVQSSRQTTTSLPSWSWRFTIRSGVRFHFSPVAGSRKITSLSRMTPRFGSWRMRLQTWKPPESLMIGRSQSMNRWIPPAACTTRAPGRLQQVEGVDDDPLDADGPQVLAAHAAHAGARRVRQEGRDGQRAAAGDERLSHRA